MPRLPSDSVAIAKFGPPWAVVYVYGPKPGATRKLFRVYCKPPVGDVIQKQRKHKADAVALAREIGEKLKRNGPGEQVDSIGPAERQLLDLCGQLRNPRRSLEELVEREKRLERRYTVAEIFEAWTNHQKGNAGETQKSATARTAHFLKTFGDRFFDSITPGEVRSWRDGLELAERTKNNYLAEVRAAFNHAIDYQLVEGPNPAKAVEKRKVAKTEVTTWEAPMLAAALSSLPPQHVPYLAIGAFAGLRPTEISGIPGQRSGLLWSDIDFDARHIHVRAEVAQKINEARYIEFKAVPELGLTEALAEKLWHGLTTWLEPHRKVGDEPVAARKSAAIVSLHLRSAGLIKAWPNDVIRHSWISYMLAHKVSRQLVADLAGNSPDIIRANYRKPVPVETARPWFEVRPSSGTEKKIIGIGEAA